MHKTVIIGAGFGGLTAARALTGKPVDVTLVDRHNFHTFQPLLYEVATAGLDPGDVAYPVRAAIGRDPNLHFRLGTVTAIDWSEQRICFAGGDATHDATSDACADDLPFDSLIVATGAVANFFGVPGAARYAHPLYTLNDARKLRNHILLRFEEADAEPDAHHEDGTLNFVIVGGGPTGVEVGGAIAELLDVSVEHDGFDFDRSSARIIIVDGLDHLLGTFKRSAQHYAEATLRSRTVELRLGETVSRITPAEVELHDGTVIPTRTVIWAGGVTVHGTLASTLGAPSTHGGRVVVDSNLEVGMHEGVFAIGDAAAIPLAPGSDQTCPQLAQVAIQSGRHAAAQVVRLVAGEPMKPFHYLDKGIMATIGRKAAVAQLRGGIVLRGTIGWMAWFGLHLVYLMGFRNKVTVLINWAWRYLNWTSGPRVILGNDAQVVDERPAGGSATSGP